MSVEKEPPKTRVAIHLFEPGPCFSRRGVAFVEIRCTEEVLFDNVLPAIAKTVADIEGVEVHSVDEGRRRHAPLYTPAHPPGVPFPRKDK